MLKQADLNNNNWGINLRKWYALDAATPAGVEYTPVKWETDYNLIPIPLLA